MALRRALTDRFFNISSSKSPSNNANSIFKANFHREFLTTPSPPDTTTTSFFRRFLQLRATSLNLPVGDKLREKLKSLNGNISAAEKLGRLDGLAPPLSAAEQVTPTEARKILMTWQLEMVKRKLREFKMSSISHGEYVRVCEEACGHNSLGLEISKMLDLSGHVIVLGNIVFLRPDQVAKSLEKLIYQSTAKPDDPRRKEVEEMEKIKAIIDEKAESLVKVELYGGLSFFIIQTLGFMRLTFWELSWDVMEPICFFTSSFYFGLAYCFFMRTSTEPSFQGYFKQRFLVKQRKLMKLENFDIDRYNHLHGKFYPDESNRLTRSGLCKTNSFVPVDD